MRIALLGVGRMGQAVTRVAHAAGHGVVVAVDRGEVVGQDVGECAGLKPTGVRVVGELDAIGATPADVLIDFSLPEVAGAMLGRAGEWGLPVVTGTTGFDAEEELARLAARVPVVAAANFSQGVAVLLHLCRIASESLPAFDAEIAEVHHRRKIDSPSGTARRMADAVRAARPGREVHGRSGTVGARTDEELGVFGLRGGDVVGEHTLFLFGEGERVELTHRATDRAIFARGAVRAAEWLQGRPPGRYDMPDVLGLVAGGAPEADAETAS